MLVVVQIPIVDLRALRGGEPAVLRAPRWGRPRLYPTAQRDFLRGVGAMNLRKQEAPWLAESHYIDAKRTIRFASNLHKIGLYPIFRRVYHEDLVYRLEIGLDLGYELRQTLRAESPPWSIARTVLALPVHLTGSDEQPVPLANFGPVLARRLAAATVSSGGKARRRGDELIDGTAAVVIEWHGRDTEDRAPFVQEWLTLPYARASGWLLEKSWQHTTGGQTRLLRLHITRLHADLALTDVILDACERKLVDEGSEPVLRSLDRLATRLNKSTLHGYEQRDAVRRIAASAGEHYAQKSDTLIRLRELAESDPEKRRLRYLLEHFGGDIVTQKNVVNSDGDGNIIQVGTNLHNQMRDNIVKSTVGTSLPDLTAELLREISALRARLGEEAPDVEDAAEGLRKEAEKDRPDHGAMRRRLTKIGAVAKTVGDAGLKVLSIVAKIMELIPG
jgi:hypothetical protein